MATVIQKRYLFSYLTLIMTQEEYMECDIFVWAAPELVSNDCKSSLLYISVISVKSF